MRCPAWFRLFPVRSPLLRESRLISLPPGTEMFQFPGLLAEIPGSMLVWQLPRAFRGLRRPHRMAPRHPPYALRSLTTPIRAAPRGGARLGFRVISIPHRPASAPRGVVPGLRVSSNASRSKGSRVILLVIGEYVPLATCFTADFSRSRDDATGVTPLPHRVVGRRWDRTDQGRGRMIPAAAAHVQACPELTAPAPFRGPGRIGSIVPLR